jgi:hypothetical protein
MVNLLGTPTREEEICVARQDGNICSDRAENILAFGDQNLGPSFTIETSARRSLFNSTLQLLE